MVNKGFAPVGTKALKPIASTHLLLRWVHPYGRRRGIFMPSHKEPALHMRKVGSLA